MLLFKLKVFVQNINQLEKYDIFFYKVVVFKVIKISSTFTSCKIKVMNTLMHHINESELWLLILRLRIRAKQTNKMEPGEEGNILEENPSFPTLKDKEKNSDIS